QGRQPRQPDQRPSCPSRDSRHRPKGGPMSPPDPQIKARLSRAVDPIPFDVGARLEELHAGHVRASVRRRAGTIAFALVLAAVAVFVAWRMLPLGDRTAPARGGGEP